MRNAGKIMIAAAAAVALGACSPSLEDPTDVPLKDQPVHTPASATVSQVEEGTEPGAAEGSQTGAEHGGQSGQCTAEDIAVNTSGEQPKVTIPHDCAAPTKVVTSDLEQGQGVAAQPGSTVELNYEIVGWADGEVADSTYPNQPTSVVLGQEGELQGWDQGLAGIKAGGTRLIVLPPDLGYDAQSGNPLADASLVVVVTVDSVA